LHRRTGDLGVMYRADLVPNDPGVLLPVHGPSRQRATIGYCFIHGPNRQRVTMGCALRQKLRGMKRVRRGRIAEGG
jgi:hypothetical protein